MDKLSGREDEEKKKAAAEEAKRIELEKQEEAKRAAKEKASLILQQQREKEQKEQKPLPTAPAPNPAAPTSWASKVNSNPQRNSNNNNNAQQQQINNKNNSQSSSLPLSNQAPMKPVVPSSVSSVTSSVAVTNKGAESPKVRLPGALNVPQNTEFAFGSFHLDGEKKRKKERKK